MNRATAIGLALSLAGAAPAVSAWADGGSTPPIRPVAYSTAQQQDPGGNDFVNGDFEQGMYGWEWDYQQEEWGNTDIHVKVKASDQPYSVPGDNILQMIASLTVKGYDGAIPETQSSAWVQIEVGQYFDHHEAEQIVAATAINLGVIATPDARASIRLSMEVQNLTARYRVVQDLYDLEIKGAKCRVRALTAMVPWKKVRQALADVQAQDGDELYIRFLLTISAETTKRDGYLDIFVAALVDDVALVDASHQTPCGLDPKSQGKPIIFTTTLDSAEERTDYRPLPWPLPDTRPRLGISKDPGEKPDPAGRPEGILGNAASLSTSSEQDGDAFFSTTDPQKAFLSTTNPHNAFLSTTEPQDAFLSTTKKSEGNLSGSSGPPSVSDVFPFLSTSASIKTTKDKLETDPGDPCDSNISITGTGG